MKYENRWALILTGIIILFFIIQNIIPWFTNLFILNSDLVFSRPWTLITSMFLHGSLIHLLLNGFALALFGSLLENILGSKKFLFLFFLTGLIANIPAFLFYKASLGASGAIFGVLGTLTVLRPNMTIWVSYMPMPMWIAAIVWALQDVFGILAPSGIANLAHLGGLFAGLILGFFYRKDHAKNRKKKNKDIMLSDDEIEEWERSNFKV